MISVYITRYGISSEVPLNEIQKRCWLGVRLNGPHTRTPLARAALAHAPAAARIAHGEPNALGVR
jgi:hypothetical protein